MSYVTESDIRVKSYDHSAFSRASVVQFRASRYIMSPNRISEWNVMTIGISWEHPYFNYEGLDILCTRIGYSCEKLWPFKFLESFRCSISSVTIYYAANRTSEWKIRPIWNSRELPLLNFEHLDMLCALIAHPSEKLLPLQFLESTVVQFQASRWVMSPNRTFV